MIVIVQCMAGKDCSTGGRERIRTGNQTKEERQMKTQDMVREQLTPEEIERLEDERDARIADEILEKIQKNPERIIPADKFWKRVG